MSSKTRITNDTVRIVLQPKKFAEFIQRLEEAKNLPPSPALKRLLARKVPWEK